MLGELKTLIKLRKYKNGVGIKGKKRQGIIIKNIMLIIKKERRKE
jgi:hypothetical protein